MRQITFTNEVNGKSVSFRTDDPLMFLEEFSGSTCGSTPIVYKPAEFDGQKFISAHLNARKITATVNFSAVVNRKYSYSAAAAKWDDEILPAIIPGQYGTLEWTDGTHTRFIRCRADEAPQPVVKAKPALFAAQISFTADKPYWQDSILNTVDITGAYSTFSINNDCGIAVPFVFEADSGAPFIYSNTLGVGVAFVADVSGGITVDTDRCTVADSGGNLVNHLLTVDSEFFRLMPGSNSLTVLPGVGSSGGTGTLKWRKAYMGVL